jgi:hypothetical protein
MSIMRTGLLFIVVLAASSRTANVSGTWELSVDLRDLGPGSAVVAIKQNGHRLSGTWDGSGPAGNRNDVTGTIDGTKVSIHHTILTWGGASMPLRLTGTLNGPSKMNGIVERSGVAIGEWTAVKKK